MKKILTPANLIAAGIGVLACAIVFSGNGLAVLAGIGLVLWGYFKHNR